MLGLVFGMEKSDFILPPFKDVTLRLARPDERRRWDATMAQRHYLGFNLPSRCYVAEYQKCWRPDRLAIGRLQCRPRDRGSARQVPRLRLIAPPGWC